MSCLVQLTSRDTCGPFVSVCVAPEHVMQHICEKSGNRDRSLFQISLLSKATSETLP